MKAPGLASDFGRKQFLTKRQVGVLVLVEEPFQVGSGVVHNGSPFYL